MNRKLRAIMISLPAFFLSAGILIHSHEQRVKVSALTTVSQTEIDQYYKDIDDEAQGTTLLKQLQDLNDAKKTKSVGYGGFRFFAAKSDIDPTGSGKIVGFYDNTLVGPDWDGGSTWNREHMWPKSRSGSKVEDDAHMVRPAAVKTNSDRGNQFFAESGAYDPGQYFEEYRGVSARIIFYCAVADPTLKVIDTTYDSATNGTMGKLSDLLKWNLEYNAQNELYADTLAIKTELNRNNVIYKDSQGQGNRNPFIDHPEYACKIWGNTNDATKAVCSGYVEEVTLEKIELSDVVTEYNVGDEFIKPTVTAYYSDKSSKVVTENAYFAGYDLDYPGEQEVVVTYSDTKGMKQVSYTIVVTGDLPLVDLEIVNPVIDYEVNDEFIKPQVNAIDAEGNRIDVSDEVEFTGFDSSEAGTITVTATYGDLSKEFEVTINAPLPITVFNLSYSELNLDVGQERKVFAHIEPDEYSSQQIEWTSSNEQVATVYYGTIKALAVGEATIRARIVGTHFVAECKVIVKEKEPTPIPTPSPTTPATPSEPETPTPITPPTPTPEKPEKRGCSGSVIASSIVLSMTSVIAVSLFINKKRK